MTIRPHLDQDALAELQDVMEDEFGVLIRTFIEDSKSRIATLRQTLASGDNDAFMNSVHSLKGSSTNIGAPQLGLLCAQAEVAGRAGQMTEVRALLAEIENEFHVVELLFERWLCSAT
ncbi:Hpt domain-containing protein [Marinobacter sp. X15-166B]|uniref:Hpt domain-containing protein n=1 Tax=Marinobacter sp. X15-166B TaxID=1897620 RepID=UPI00085C106B|nr:Hpt domain-containing protein [Marinobacter sp. X15-166B]OEY67070.1 histidine kinase [Marinobacter sp. X15-166B]